MCSILLPHDLYKCFLSSITFHLYIYPTWHCWVCLAVHIYQVFVFGGCCIFIAGIWPPNSFKIEDVLESLSICSDTYWRTVPTCLSCSLADLPCRSCHLRNSRGGGLLVKLWAWKYESWGAYLWMDPAGIQLVLAVSLEGVVWAHHSPHSCSLRGGVNLQNLQPLRQGLQEANLSASAKLSLVYVRWLAIKTYFKFTFLATLTWILCLWLKPGRILVSPAVVLKFYQMTVHTLLHRGLLDIHTTSLMLLFIYRWPRRFRGTDSCGPVWPPATLCHSDNTSFICIIWMVQVHVFLYL